MARMTALASIALPSLSRTVLAGPFTSSAGHLAGGQQLGAELDGLPPRPVGELAAGQAVGEAEVVLDPRALPRLAAGGELLDEHGAQPLGRAVDRRAEPGRAAADHDQVVEVALRDGRQADLGGDLGVASA